MILMYVVYEFTLLHVVFGRLLRDADHHAAACAM
jgi:hypothetical protein